MKKSKYFLILVFILALYSCNEKKVGVGNFTLLFDVKDFKPLTNWNQYSVADSNKKQLYLDYLDAIQGFSIPSIRQTSDGFFTFSFLIRNRTKSDRKFKFKIYYQNESYKFQENIENTNSENPLAAENYYGSWEDTQVTFLETQEIPCDNNFHLVETKLRITGNPRNEERYFYKSENQRWTRNPRVGDYSFLLVVAENENIIPDYIADISLKKDEKFVNPYYYYLYGDGSKTGNIIILKSKDLLNVAAKPDLSRGIYSNPQDFPPEKFSNYYSNNCAYSVDFFLNAPLSQFINHVHPSSSMKNIPVIYDILGGNYSSMDYNWNKAFYYSNELIDGTPKTADCPCRDTYYDSTGKFVVIKNPAAKYGEWKKQSVGVITRHGFTYGKFTVKLKLTELLSENGIWNGITNAIWLITNGNEPWNDCRICPKEGYLSDYWGGEKSRRTSTTSYSEIDFEILKTVNYCPSYQFPPAYFYPVADRNQLRFWNVPTEPGNEKNIGNVMVCCTNWDMACPSPEKYDVGCKPLTYGNKTFLVHRWDYWYRSLTTRTPSSDNEMFAAPYYFFQIDWKPDEIIWRIGPEKDHLRVVGYMNSSVTTIPNNQMLLVISQEFHNTDWWHGSPYEQKYIPFPEKDIIGKIFEITVE